MLCPGVHFAALQRRLSSGFWTYAGVQYSRMWEQHWCRSKLSSFLLLYSRAMCNCLYIYIGAITLQKFCFSEHKEFRILHSAENQGNSPTTHRAGRSFDRCGHYCRVQTESRWTEPKKSMLLNHKLGTGPHVLLVLSWCFVAVLSALEALDAFI